MPESREDERFKQDAIDDDLESLEELLEDTYLSAPGVSRRPRVEVGLELLLKGAKKGYTIDELVDDLDDYDIDTYLSVLLAAGANPDKLASRLGDEDLVKHLDELLNAGAKIDIDSLIAKLNRGYIVSHQAELLAAGANPDKLVARLDAKDIAYNLNKLREVGAKIDVDRLVGQLTPRPIADNLDELRAAGAKIDLDRLMKKVSPAMVRDDLDQLLRAGVDPYKLMGRCDDVRVLSWYVDELVAAGAAIDVNLLASQLFRRDVLRWAYNRRQLGRYVEKFLSAGMDPERLICVLKDSGMRNWLKNDDIDLLATAAGVDSDEIRARLHP